VTMARFDKKRPTKSSDSRGSGSRGESKLRADSKSTGRRDGKLRSDSKTPYNREDRKKLGTRSTYSRDDKPKSDSRTPYNREDSKNTGTRSTYSRDDRPRTESRYDGPKKSIFRNRVTKKSSTPSKPGMRLNQYIAHSGISSRREADQLIVAGLVSVNGKVITEMGFRVLDKDVVKFNNETISSEKLQYLLLNKPKGYLVSDDPSKKKTVTELMGSACKERVYPVGRLDRQTSGLLLFTNDGILSKKLTDPKHRFKKIYHVSLDKNLKAIDMKKIVEGVNIDGNVIEIQQISYVQNASKKEVGLEMHIGKNKNISDVFEKLGYSLTKLDRVYFGGLTKKDIPRGRHRFLNDQEVAMLKMI